MRTRKWMFVMGSIVLLTALAIVVGTALASTQEDAYPDCGVNLSVTPAVVAPGGTVTATGDSPGNPLVLLQPSWMESGDFVPGSGFSQEYTVPTIIGMYSINAQADEGCDVVSVSFSVAAPVAAQTSSQTPVTVPASSVAPSGSLPNTGFELLPFLGSAGILSGAGSALLMRRRTFRR